MIEPEYYHDGGIDVIDYAVMKFGVAAAKSFCRINIIKYITRYEQKNGVEDLEKAKTYMYRLIELEKGNVKVNPKKVVKNYIKAIEGVRTHENGLKEYKCAYTCQCGNSGTRYIDINAEQTACHKCKCVMKVYPSTESDAHDDEYNYFYAY